MAERRHYSIILFIIALSASLWVPARAQETTTIQLFLPGGVLPSREIRFTVTYEEGGNEVLITDSKGKYQLSGDLGREYVIVVKGDGRVYDTTILRFRFMQGGAYVPVFLDPVKGSAPHPKANVDISVYDAKVPAEAKAAYENATKAASENNDEAAISELARALSLYPQYLRALNDLGALYLKLNRQGEAISAFTQAISLNPGVPLARMNLGVVYIRQQRYDEAIKILDTLVKEHPSLTTARIHLAQALLNSRQMDAAMEQIRLALADKNLDSAVRADAHLSLGFLLNREERYAAAATELEKSIAINPKVAIAHMYLGGALLNLKKMAEAEAALRKAYELGGSGVAGAQLLLGQLYYQQKKYELAQLSFEQYLKDMPKASNAAQVKALIEKAKAAMKQE